MIRIPQERVDYLLARYRKATLADIAEIEGLTERWMRQHVREAYLQAGSMPQEFHVLPILRVHAWFGTDKHTRHAATFGAWLVIEGYRRL